MRPSPRPRRCAPAPRPGSSVPPLVSHIFCAVDDVARRRPATALRPDRRRRRSPGPARTSRTRRAPPRSAICGRYRCLLLRRAVLGEHVRDDEVGVDDAGDAHPAARDLLDDQRVGQQRLAEPAVLLGDRQPEQAHLLHARRRSPAGTRRRARARCACGMISLSTNVPPSTRISCWISVRPAVWARRAMRSSRLASRPPVRTHDPALGGAPEVSPASGMTSARL